MGAVRKRFTPADRAVFTEGTEVEWLNGSHWQPGVITGPITTDRDGYQEVPVRNLADTRTIHKGQRITGTPKHLRLPPGPVPTTDMTAEFTPAAAVVPCPKGCPDVAYCEHAHLYYTERGKAHRKHDVHGGPHDEPPAGAQ